MLSETHIFRPRGHDPERSIRARSRTSCSSRSAHRFSERAMLSVSQGMLLNAYCHISSTLSEMYGEPNLSITQNADSPVLSSPSCMVRVVSAFMDRKFSLPIYLRVPEAPSYMRLTVCGIFISVTDVQPENAFSPIASSPDGKVSLTRFRENGTIRKKRMRLS